MTFDKIDKYTTLNEQISRFVEVYLTAPSAADLRTLRRIQDELGEDLAREIENEMFAGGEVEEYRTALPSLRDEQGEGNSVNSFSSNHL